ncbi:MAG: TetR family transcriptional regulator [Myxococcales bacterium]|nr:TetR family transcriptional regulator [Myxococcales bacterium]
MSAAAPPEREAQASTRDRILDVAEQVFAQKGFAGAKTQVIADAARVDKKLLFYYFRNKEGLYREVITRFLTGVGRFNVDTEYQAGTARDNLERISNALNDLMASHPNAVKIVFREVLDQGAVFQEILSEVLPTVFETGARNLEAWRARGEIGDLDPRHFMLSFGGMVLVYHLAAGVLAGAWGTDPLSAEEQAKRKREVLRLALEGLAPRPT